MAAAGEGLTSGSGDEAADVQESSMEDHRQSPPIKVVALPTAPPVDRATVWQPVLDGFVTALDRAPEGDPDREGLLRCYRHVLTIAQQSPLALVREPLQKRLG